MTDLPVTLPPRFAVDDEPFPVQLIDRLGTDGALAALADADLPPELAPLARFRIDSDDLAEWAMAHVAEVAANRAQIVAQRDAYVERVERWCAEMTARLDKRAEFFDAHLIDYAARRRAEDPKNNKTLRLPSGVVKSTEAQPKPDVAPAGARDVYEWAKVAIPDDEARAEVVQEAVKVALVEFRKHVKVSGRQAGWLVTADCGHEQRVPDDGPTYTGPDVDESIECPDCTDPLTGEPAHRLVTEVLPWLVQVVTDAAGRPVPGTLVRPGGVTFKVVPA